VLFFLSFISNTVQSLRECRLIQLCLCRFSLFSLSSLSSLSLISRSLIPLYLFLSLHLCCFSFSSAFSSLFSLSLLSPCASRSPPRLIFRIAALVNAMTTTLHAMTKHIQHISVCLSLSLSLSLSLFLSLSQCAGRSLPGLIFRSSLQCTP
jgi:hypothetical protein